MGKRRFKQIKVGPWFIAVDYIGRDEDRKFAMHRVDYDGTWYAVWLWSIAITVTDSGHAWADQTRPREPK